MPSSKQRQLQRQQARQQQKKRRLIYLGAGLIALVLALVAVGFYINPIHATKFSNSRLWRVRIPGR